MTNICGEIAIFAYMNMYVLLKKNVVLLMALMISASCFFSRGDNPKREFRGAWMHTVFQDGYLKRSSRENQSYIIKELDNLKAAGINAVLFQVRPQSDAFYDSRLEPWSRFITDNGKAPMPYWDPLKFIIKEAHARGMELHAWLNPYRVTSSANQILPRSHIYYKYPERFVKYAGKLYFDPGLPENRKYIEKIVTDIVERYDVDGIHFDDYFYPYPVKRIKFDDGKSYAKYGKGKDLGDWRRDNVNLLINSLNKKIKSIKPWVRFGVSPFGIWRNKSTDPRGSETDGLQNYDALYADVLLWIEKGWVDYLIPQIYWEIEHPKASYPTLVEWWSLNCGKRHVYIGQSVDVTMNKCGVGGSKEMTQLKDKIDISRRASNIGGNCWWPSYSVTKNVGGISDSLSMYQQSTPAIPPAYTWLWNVLPESVSELIIKDGVMSWHAPEPAGMVSDCVRFVVYRFDDDATFDLEDPSKIIAITPDTSIKVSLPGYYVVTALDRVNNESLPSDIIIYKK